jgi:ArsR family transcriptional regulator, arsenate/arsenite/antimonite-responsive transcriptional repressor
MSDVFDVLADQTRREIVQLLHTPDQGSTELSVGALVEALGMTQPTVSKHLKVLREAGLVSVREDGQHRYYRLDPTPLVDVANWVVGLTGGAARTAGAPFVDLEPMGRAVGGLLVDVQEWVTNAVKTISK